MAVLKEAQDRGLVGPGSIDDHIEHSLGFVEILRAGPAQRVLDLGAGGGLPGLVLGAFLPEIRLGLLDGSERRVSWLEEAISRLGLARSVFVLPGRAEELAHRPELRGSFDGVTSRAFGTPAATAECAAGFLRLGGSLIVSEPPAAEEGRWSEQGLAELGFAPPRALKAGGHHFVRIELAHEPSSRDPRRVGVPQKRPLF